MLVAIYWLEFAGGWGMWGLLTFFGRDLLGCLARFDLLDGIYFLSFAGSCLQGEVC